MQSSRVTTSKGRDFAFRLRAMRNKRSRRKVWYVGLVTQRYFWLDLNTPKYLQAVSLACILRDRLQTAVYIFQTSKSFHLITKKPLDRQRWRLEYAWWLNNFSDDVVCHAFCLCCLRYNKATIRVSFKNGNRPKLISVIGDEEKPTATFSVKPISAGLRMTSQGGRTEE